MAKTDLKTVPDYIAAQPKAMRPLLRAVRSAIRKGATGAEESISYGLPTYKLRGRPVIYFAGWKHHFSIYPCTARLVQALKTELSGCEIEKGTIRFPLSEPAPVKLIEAIARVRTEEVSSLEAQRRSR